MDSTRAAAYLERIGAAWPDTPDAEALRELHVRHLRTVPFENLSIHLGEEIVLAPDALVDKILGGRGGFCYELNGAFAALLRALGYEVDLLAARVPGEDGRLGPPYDHLTLRVRTSDGALLLADVGFGRHSHYPLAYDVRGDQPGDPGGVFRLADAEEGDVEVLLNGRPQYRFEQRPRALGDFEATCWWHRTSPASHFRTSLVCSRLTGDGRITLSGRTVVRTTDQERMEHTLKEAEVLPAYQELFGITLNREPVVTPRPPAS